MIVLIIGPSGSGKTTLVESLINHHPTKYEKIITLTTRAPRTVEVHNRDYEFVSVEDFLAQKEFLLLIRNKQPGVYYGTRRAAFVETGKHKLLVTDYGAVDHLMSSNINNLFLVVLKLSDEQKRLRMLDRGDLSNEIELRISQERSRTFGAHPLISSVIIDASKSATEIAHYVHITLSRTG